MSEQIFKLTSALNARLARIRQKGCTVQVTQDFEEASRILTGTGKPYLTPTLSPKWNDFTGENCFWMHISHRQEVLGAVGVKREAIGGEAVSKYWKRIHRRQYPRDDDGEVIERVSPLLDRTLRGDLAYFGDLFFNPRLRSLHVTEDFGHAALYHAALCFHSDFFYAFLKDRDLRRGFGFQLGLMHCVRQAQVWADPIPETRGSHEACCYSTLDDVAALSELDVGLA